MTYDNIHRFFLRTMANRGVMSMTESVKVLKEFTGMFFTPYSYYVHLKYLFKFCSYFSGQNVSVSISKLVEEINNEISPFRQRITIVKDKNTESCEETLIFIMMVADNATKCQKIFTEKELNYFRKLIEEIISTESREIDYYTAFNLTKTFVTKKEAEVKYLFFHIITFSY